MEDLLKSLPKLPDKINQILLFLVPIYAMLYGVVGFLGVVVLGSAVLSTHIDLASLFSSINQRTGNPFGAISILLGLVLGVILFISVPQLIKRQKLGWNLLLISEVIRFIAGLLFSFSSGLSFVELGISALSLYLILQLRSYYK